MSTSVVTRFAPSPTGFLHIGGGRTALFNWLFARARKGVFHLRIEDTDRERSTDAAIEAIIDGLKWLGLEWDDTVVYQFARAERHREAVDSLLARGRAYHCYATPQELEQMREAAKAAGQSMRYDGRWRDRDPKEAPAGVKPVVRLRAPLDGETVIEDKVQGRVVWQNKDLDDLVLLRSDGTPTYMLAVVVDDHDMGITQVIRGDDHLNNAARQSQIYQAFEWPMPAMAHIPLIHGQDGAKLSKRHGALGIDAYRAMGYLPAAMRNYLVRLSWSHGDTEFFSTGEMIEKFDLAHVGRSAARFDIAKLDNINGHYIRAMTNEVLAETLEAALPYLPGGGALAEKLDGILREKLVKAMPGLKERAKTLVELLNGAAFLFADRPISVDDKAKDVLDHKGRKHLAALLPALTALPDWTAPLTEAAVRAYALEVGAKLGDIAQPLRAALTGRTTSPGVFDLLAVLGREESLGRIDDQASL